jgi:hypothetical protein
VIELRLHRPRSQLLPGNFRQTAPFRREPPRALSAKNATLPKRRQEDIHGRDWQLQGQLSAEAPGSLFDSS